MAFALGVAGMPCTGGSRMSPHTQGKHEGGWNLGRHTAPNLIFRQWAKRIEPRIGLVYSTWIVRVPHGILVIPPYDPKLKTAPLGKSVGSVPKIGSTSDVTATVASSGSNGSFFSSSCMTQQSRPLRAFAESSRNEIQPDTEAIQDYLHA